MSSNCTSSSVGSSSSSSNHIANNNIKTLAGGSQGAMTLATTKFLKLNQSHFTHQQQQQQGMDYLPTPSPSESSDYYQPHHPIPYHLVTPHHQYYPHTGHQQSYPTSTTSPMQQKNRHHYGTVSSGTNRGVGKMYPGHHTYQSIGPSTISSKLRDDEHLYAKPDNMGNIEIIKSKHARTYDEMNNEI